MQLRIYAYDLNMKHVYWGDDNSILFAELKGRHTLEDQVADGRVILKLMSNKYDWKMGRDSSVGIATRYEMDDPGIESRVG
jgi:hypothetical protein